MGGWIIVIAIIFFVIFDIAILVWLVRRNMRKGRASPLAPPSDNRRGDS